ncbi:MAG: CRISPR-associated endonuclease Cas2 [Candidatus Nitrosocaldaceae archaeon]
MVMILYIIMVYDVGIERVNKVLKVGRKYLIWIQNSVLEGEITDADFIRLKEEISNIIDKESDSVLFFSLRSKYDSKIVIGKVKNEPNVFI